MLSSLCVPQQKAILLKFEIQRKIDEPLKFQMDFSYDDAVEVLDRVNISNHLTLQPTSDKAVFEQSIHLHRSAIFSSVG